MLTGPLTDRGECMASSYSRKLLVLLGTSAAALVSMRPLWTSHASASLSDKVRIGTTLGFDLGTAPTSAPLRESN